MSFFIVVAYHLQGGLNPPVEPIFPHLSAITLVKYYTDMAMFMSQSRITGLKYDIESLVNRLIVEIHTDPVLQHDPVEVKDVLNLRSAIGKITSKC